MKVIELKVPGSDREPLIFELCPDTTTADILAAADLSADCALVRACAPMHPLSPEEELYNQLTDCETLYAFFRNGD